MLSFSKRIRKVGINPYVGVPREVLQGLLRQAGKNKGPVPVHGKLNGKHFRQTVLKSQGTWRLYCNTEMRRNASVDVGDTARVEIEFDPAPRGVPMHPVLDRALAKNKAAKAAFEKFRPSRQKEILRYLHSLKT